MKILTPSHKYELANFEDPFKPGQILQFIEKERLPDGIHLKTINDGTTNEEVLLMLIDRLKGLNEKLPTREASIAITKCEEALLWLHKRTADRIERNVKGTMRA